MTASHEAVSKGIELSQFEALGLARSILRSVEKLGFDKPTPIQAQAIPLILQGHDIMGLAQTGTGKTAAFGLPLIHHLIETNEKPANRQVRSLILAPTRELANQIAANMREYLRGTPLRIVVVVGGASINLQNRNLANGADILVATPGRLLDLVERRAVSLSSVKFLVLDEADQMLDLGFIHALRTISKMVGQPRQTLLFSATMPKQIAELSRTYQNDPVRIEVSPPGKAADKVRQSVHFVAQRGKADLLKQCLAERKEDLSLVFARTKHGAEKLMKSLVASGYPAASIHGNKSQGQRERALDSFRRGEVRVLVATDVAARGIDISGVSHVYNFDLPEVPENYVHRIGRTARAGAAGEAVAFCSPDENRMLRDIERLMKVEIIVASGERSSARASSKQADVEQGANGASRRPAGRPSRNSRPDHAGRGERNDRPDRNRQAGENGRMRERNQLTAAPAEAEAPHAHSRTENTGRGRPQGQRAHGKPQQPARAQQQPARAQQQPGASQPRREARPGADNRTAGKPAGVAKGKPRKWQRQKRRKAFA
ncbi:MAG: DEAD/DEAH box helicase [Rhizobiaceae bacterium]